MSESYPRIRPQRCPGIRRSLLKGYRAASSASSRLFPAAPTCRGTWPPPQVLRGQRQRCDSGQRVRSAGPVPTRNGAGTYFTSTVAPASVNFFLMFSASSLETPSFTVLGAPSTRSLASFRPRLVTSRTALITLILLAPTAVRTTANSVFSSAGAAAAAPAPAPPAIMTGAAAAAETPRRSSNFFTRAAASRSESPTIVSSNCCKSAMCLSTCSLFVVLISLPVFEASNVPPHARLTQAARLTTDNANPKGALAHSQTRVCPGLSLRFCRPRFSRRHYRRRFLCATKLVLLHTLVDHNRQIAPNGVHHRYQALRRSVHQEQQLGVDFSLRRHASQRINVLNRDDAAVHDAGLEGVLRI